MANIERIMESPLYLTNRRRLYNVLSSRLQAWSAIEWSKQTWLQARLAIRCRYLIMHTGVIGTECINKLIFFLSCWNFLCKRYNWQKSSQSKSRSRRPYSRLPASKEITASHFLLYNASFIWHRSTFQQANFSKY